MARPGKVRPLCGRSRLSPRLEPLEGRFLPTGVNWLSALGIGVSGTNSTIHSNAVATDPAGDTFITGSFRGTASFNPSLPGSTITTSGTQDTFVAKYGPTGSLGWVKTFAGTTTTTGNSTISAVSQGSAIVIDGSGNLFVAGGFSGTVNLSGTSGTTAITSPTATTEVDLVKLDPNGNLIWVDVVAGTQYDTDEAFGLALDGSGGVVMAGSFADSATFGTTTLTVGGSSDAFVSRVNGSGQFVWSVATRGSGGSNAQVNGVAVDSSGNVVLAGQFSGTVDFDPSASVTTLTSNGSVDAVAWKLTSSGGFTWARSFGSTDFDAATAVAVDPQGNLYETGAFSDSVAFGSTTLTAGPIFDAFVVKLSPSGSVVWADGLVGPGGWSKALGIAIDPFGDVDLGGTFQGLVDFNPGSSAVNLTSVGYTDVFAAGLDANGNFLYAIQAGQSNFNGTLGVSVNSSGLIAATGSYSGSISFGATNLPILGVASTFVATLQAPSAPPAAPSSPILDASSDTGLSSTDGITSATSPLFDINTAIVGDTVELLRNGAVVGSRTGPGTIRDPGPLTQGTYSYSAVQLASGGMPSQPSGTTSITVLTNPPAAPPAPTLFASDDSGVLGDGITNVRQPRLTVVAPAASTVQIVNASGTVLATAFTSTAGSVTLSLALPLVDGTYPLIARAIDLAGNIGLNSPGFSLTILATPPPAPTPPSLLAADVTGPAGGTLTSVRQPRFTGTAKVGTTVELFTSTGTMLGSGTVGSGGTYTIKVASPLGDGTYSVDALSVDVAANQSVLSPTSSLTIDGTPPVAPTGLGLLAADDSGVIGDGITNVRQPRLTGQAEPGSTVQIVDSTGKVQASAVASGNGSFTATVGAALTDGTYTLQARATDLAGNVGPLGLAFTLRILATPPAAPTALALLAADDSGNSTTTNVRQPRLTGSAAPSTTVQILGPTGTVYATVASGSTGSYVVKLMNPLSDGTYVLHAVATDVAGNSSPAGPTFSLTILTATPATPSALKLFASDDSGTVGDNITNVRQPRLTSTATAGITVQLVNAANVVIGSTTASGSGAVTVAPGSPLADGTYVLHLVAVDAAGNLSAAGASLSLTILATPPAAPASPTLLAADVAAGSNGSITTFARPTIVGKVGLGARVDWIGSGGSIIASTTASAQTGSYQLIAPTAFVNGSLAVVVRQTDVAGNVSPLSSAFNLTIRVDPGDDFGAGQTSLSVFNSSTLTFSVANPITNATFTKPFAIPGDVPVHGDFFGNGHDDIAVFRPSTSTFYVFDPITTAYEAVTLGTAGDVPVPADYDGDGQTDFAVFMPSNNTFTVLMSATSTIYQKTFAISGDVPVPADYYGNGHADIAVYRPSTSTFYVTDPITNAYEVAAVGIAGSTPIPADYEGLGHADFAVFEPGLCNFVVKLTASNVTYVKTFALPGDLPVLGDNFGDGHADLTVFRPSTATFYQFEIGNGAYKVSQLGAAGQTKPVLAPITTWFNFSTGKPNAITPRVVNENPSWLIANVIEVEPAQTSTKSARSTDQDATIDLAIDHMVTETLF